MIVVLSLNTALDRILEVRHFMIGNVQRATSSQVFAGGKGLNVARVLRQLGRPVRVVGFLGGTSAAFIRQECDALGIEQRWVAIPGELRTCVIVVDPTTGQATVINEHGPHVSMPAFREICETLERSTGEEDILCISGSAPPGAPDDLYAEIVRTVARRNVRVLVDVSGEALRLGLNEQPWAAAPNREEWLAISGDIPPVDAVKSLARSAHHAILTLGREGALYAEGDSLYHVCPPEIPTVNAVGSGDALVAGFLAGIELNQTALDALRLGVACGASNAGRLPPGLESVQAVERLRDSVTVVDVNGA